jgi:hypothetical protein
MHYNKHVDLSAKPNFSFLDPVNFRDQHQKDNNHQMRKKSVDFSFENKLKQMPNHQIPNKQVSSNLSQ